MSLGCTYEAFPPHSNPKDPKHTRLVDRDRPSANWHTTTGLNWKDQDVIFDLGTRCRVDTVAMLFDRPQKPAHVEAFVSETAEGPWKSVGKMLKQELTEPWWRLELYDVAGRYVKLFHKLDSWGWYLREVKLYGNVLVAKADAAKIAGGNLVLIENGAARSTIVVSDDASPRTLDAASRFSASPGA